MFKNLVDWLKTECGKKLPIIVFGIGAGSILLALVSAVSVIYVTGLQIDRTPMLLTALLVGGYLAQTLYVVGIAGLLTSSAMLLARKAKQFRRRKNR